MKKRQAVDPKDLANWPMIYSPAALYEYYKNKKSGNTLFECLEKDVHRADPGNLDFCKKANPCLQGCNSLFNLMNAYAHYDTEIEYCQGMNVVMAWILKHTQVSSGKVTSDER